jgi:hypothetical protein
VGTSLTGSTGTWQRVSSYAFQWLRCNSAGASCGPISGATASAYTVSSADPGYTLRFLVTATNKNGSAAAVSAATQVVPSPTSSTPAPDTAITNITCGTSVSAFPSTVCIDSNNDGGNSTTVTFTISNADKAECQMDDGSYAGTWASCTSGTVQFWVPLGRHTLYVRAKRSSDGAVDASPAAASLTVCPASGCPSPTAPAPTAPSSTSPPAISGTAQQGQTLSTSTGSWSGTTPMSYAYQWQRCNSSGTSCSPVAGATGSSYLLASADVGSTMRVSVTASNAAGSATASSVATAVVAAGSSSPIVSPWWSRTFEAPETLPQRYPYCCGTYWDTLLLSSASTGAQVVDPTDSTGTNHVFDSHVANSSETRDWSLVTQNTTDSYAFQGSDVWVKFRIFFPSSFRATGYRSGQPNSEFNWLHEFHEDSTYTTKCPSEDPGNIALGVLDSSTYATYRWRVQIFGGQQTATNCTGSIGDRDVDGPPIQLGHWYTLLEHVHFSAGSDGLYELWIDGTQAFSINGPTLYRHPDGSTERAYTHFGNYRAGGDSWAVKTTWTADVYYDDVAEGPSRSSVGG